MNLGRLDARPLFDDNLMNINDHFCVFLVFAAPFPSRHFLSFLFSSATFAQPFFVRPLFYFAFWAGRPDVTITAESRKDLCDDPAEHRVPPLLCLGARAAAEPTRTSQLAGQWHAGRIWRNERGAAIQPAAELRPRVRLMSVKRAVAGRTGGNA